MLVVPSGLVVVILSVDESITVIVPLFIIVVEVGVEVTSMPLAVVVVVSPFIKVDEIT